MTLSPEEVAEVLAELYGTRFGGKANGRYRISKKELSSVCGKQYIKQSSIDEITEELLVEYDIAMVELEGEFSIIKASILRGYRSVPAKILRKISPQ
jgi:hypothetical protein